MAVSFTVEMGNEPVAPAQHLPGDGHIPGFVYRKERPRGEGDDHQGEPEDGQQESVRLAPAIHIEYSIMRIRHDTKLK